MKIYLPYGEPYIGRWPYHSALIHSQFWAPDRPRDPANIAWDQLFEYLDNQPPNLMRAIDIEPGHVDSMPTDEQFNAIMARIKRRYPDAPLIRYWEYPKWYYWLTVYMAEYAAGITTPWHEAKEAEIRTKWREQFGAARQYVRTRDHSLYSHFWLHAYCEHGDDHSQGGPDHWRLSTLFRVQAARRLYDGPLAFWVCPHIGDSQAEINQRGYIRECSWFDQQLRFLRTIANKDDCVVVWHNHRWEGGEQLLDLLSKIA